MARDSFRTGEYKQTNCCMKIHLRYPGDICAGIELETKVLVHVCVHAKTDPCMKRIKRPANKKGWLVGWSLHNNKC
jgi:hypothetical protein